jgi:hypothetical protein
MLKQASVSQIRKSEVTRKQGYVAVVMCHYPRGLRTEARDAFHSELAPDRGLFAEWKSVERESGHDEAFVRTRYEERFRLSAWALQLLHELSARAKSEDVFLVCQCGVGERCHREMLMLLARKTFAADVDTIHNSYPGWERRLRADFWPLPASALATPDRKYPA